MDRYFIPRQIHILKKEQDTHRANGTTATCSRGGSRNTTDNYYNISNDIITVSVSVLWDNMASVFLNHNSRICNLGISSLTDNKVLKVNKVFFLCYKATAMCNKLD